MTAMRCEWKLFRSLCDIAVGLGESGTGIVVIKGVKARYDALIDSGEIRADTPQAQAVALLDELQGKLDGYEPSAPRTGLAKVFGNKSKVTPPKGIYLWGGVGRGKSMLMDLFFDAANVAKKQRVHFHAFMQRVHDGLAQARAAGQRDPLQFVADEVTSKAHLLCFDELQITDITDAMIVGRLFDKLMEQGVVVVTTSNRVPDDLYKDGLNRKLFLPFIELIKDRFVVHRLEGETDHRRQALAGRDLYFSPVDEAARASIDALWGELTNQDATPLRIENKGRIIELANFSNGVARVSFEELCAQPLGPSDYLAITDAISVLIMEGIPRLSRARNNEAKRFVTLIDALYEAGVQFIATAQAEPESLYVDGEGVFEFERTASRISEMRSASWPETRQSG